MYTYNTYYVTVIPYIVFNSALIADGELVFCCSI